MDEKPRLKSWQEKRSAFYVGLIVVLVVVLSVLIVILKLKKIYRVSDNICISADCVNSSEFFLNIINNSTNPCDNFYEFACGGYEGPTSTLEEAQLRVFEELESFVIDNLHKDDWLSIKKQKKYYRACMDFTAIEEDDNRSLKKLFEELGGWPLLTKEWVNDRNLSKIVEKCVDLGLMYDWFVELDTEDDEFGNRTLRITVPSSAVFIKEKFTDNYQLLIENVAKRLRASNTLDKISVAAKSIVQFQNSLSTIVIEVPRNYTNTTINDLKYEFRNLPWDALLKNVDMEENSTIRADFVYLEKLTRLLDKTGQRTKVNYIFWKITENLNKFLPHDIRREFNDYELVVKNVTQIPRNVFCYELTQRIFAYVSEAAYAQKHNEDRRTVRRIFDNIKKVMHRHINESTWMKDSYKTRALNKLKNLGITVGGPDEVFNTTQIDQILGIDQIDILDLNKTLDVIRAVDKSRDKYNLTLRRKQITNLKARLYQSIVDIQSTRYLPQDNLIYFPAAVLGGIFDFQKGLNFRNYSVIGIILAHELTHAFGLLDYIDVINKKSEDFSPTLSDYDDFMNQSSCVTEQCRKLDGSFINSQCITTLDENVADYASVNIAYEAFQATKAEDINQLPGLKYNKDQLFWISYAAIMCDGMYNRTTAKIRLTHLDPYQRILGSYRNSEYFARDFNCTEDSYMNPVDKCFVL